MMARQDPSEHHCSTKNEGLVEGLMRGRPVLTCSCW